MWCKQRVLKPVIELYKGTIEELFELFYEEKNEDDYCVIHEDWREYFIQFLRDEFNIERDCDICKNAVPYEGIVIRKLDTLDFEAYKLKSFKFLQRETEELDKGQENIEDSQETKNEQI
jgi:hypothetical protein